MNITATILDQIGGKEFLKIGTAKGYLFHPETVSAPISDPSYGLRIQVGKNQSVILIIYDEDANSYFVQACKGCKNEGKVYEDVYYDMLIDIIATEADEKFPNLKCPEKYDDIIITDF